jgi:ribosomal protein S27E
MEITLHNEEDAMLLSSVLIAYEEKIEKEKLTVEPSKRAILNKLRERVDTFLIRNSFDFIGEMICIKCRRKWVAIFSYRSSKIQCPGCGFMNHILVQPVVK